MSKSAVAVLSGNGTNCEIETAHACTLAGFSKVDIIPVWELLSGKAQLQQYHMAVFPGGFLDGDDLGAAQAQANRIRHTRLPSGKPFFSELKNFINDKKLLLGICNGFQLMVKLGILPGFDQDYSKRLCSLTYNDMGKFEDRWITLSVNNDSPCVFTRGLKNIYLPVRHGEGKFITLDDDTLQRLQQNNQIVVQYANDLTKKVTEQYPANPNGSQSSIAGICDPSGRIFGLMPHPEAYVARTQHPRWTREQLPEQGAGLLLFKNARRYIDSHDFS